MNTSKSCRQTTLAHNRVVQVQHCADCGCVALHLGSVTIRIDENALEGLHTALGDAIVKLQLPQAVLQPTSLSRGLA